MGPVGRRDGDAQIAADQTESKGRATKKPDSE